jgi:hypothetical protein
MKSLHLTTLFVLLFTACTTTGPAPKTQAEDTGRIGLIADLSTHPQGPVVQLDNGKRWKANPETTQGIKSMQLLIERFPRSGMSRLQLKDTLEAEFRMIFQKCSMTGEAHEQLHNYLIPLHKMLSGMNEGTPDTEVMTMHAHLQTYGEYFE